MIEEEFKILLEKEWTIEEREIIKRIMEGLLYYKKLLPKTLKQDVLSALELCIKLKDESDELHKKIKLLLNEQQTE